MPVLVTPVFAQEDPTFGNLLQRQEILTNDEDKKITPRQSSRPVTRRVRHQISVKKEDTGPVSVKPEGQLEKPFILVPIRTALSAILTDEISNLNTTKVIAEIISDYKNARLRKCTLLGTFSFSAKKLNRLFITFDRIIYPNGDVRPISAYAVDPEDDKVGLTAKVDDKEGENVLKVIGESVTAVLAAMTHNQTAGVSSKVLDQTAGKQLDKIDTDSIISVPKDTLLKVVLDEPFKAVEYFSLEANNG